MANVEEIQIERYREERQALIDAAGSGLLSFMTDLADSFDQSLLHTQQPDHDRDYNIALLDMTGNILRELEAATDTHVQAFPRKIREVDRVRLLPGQHGGVTVLLFFPTTGITTRINIYGALRDPKSPFDTRDHDRSGRHLHNERTDRISSQEKHINVHAQNREGATFLQMWAIYQTEQYFLLDSLKVENRMLLLPLTAEDPEKPIILKRNYCFDHLKDSLTKHDRVLTMLIPNPRG